MENKKCMSFAWCKSMKGLEKERKKERKNKLGGDIKT
jgi:hypothetical protein